MGKSRKKTSKVDVMDTESLNDALMSTVYLTTSKAEGDKILALTFPSMDKPLFEETVQGKNVVAKKFLQIEDVKPSSNIDEEGLKRQLEETQQERDNLFNYSAWMSDTLKQYTADMKKQVEMATKEIAARKEFIKNNKADPKLQPHEVNIVNNKLKSEIKIWQEKQIHAAYKVGLGTAAQVNVNNFVIYCCEKASSGYKKTGKALGEGYDSASSGLSATGKAIGSGLSEARKGLGSVGTFVAGAAVYGVTVVLPHELSRAYEGTKYGVTEALPHAFSRGVEGGNYYVATPLWNLGVNFVNTAVQLGKTTGQVLSNVEGYVTGRHNRELLNALQESNNKLSAKVDGLATENVELRKDLSELTKLLQEKVLNAFKGAAKGDAKERAVKGLTAWAKGPEMQERIKASIEERKKSHEVVVPPTSGNQPK